MGEFRRAARRAVWPRGFLQRLAQDRNIASASAGWPTPTLGATPPAIKTDRVMRPAQVLVSCSSAIRAGLFDDAVDQLVDGRPTQLGETRNAPRAPRAFNGDAQNPAHRKGRGRDPRSARRPAEIPARPRLPATFPRARAIARRVLRRPRTPRPPRFAGPPQLHRPRRPVRRMPLASYQPHPHRSK